MFKNWYLKNKKILIVTISSVLICFITLNISVYLALSKSEAIQYFNATKKITDNLGIIVLPVSLSLISLVVMLVSFFILLLKTFFPNSQAFDSVTLKTERDFLLNMPHEFRKGLKKNE